jgi:hypothetical protein
MNVPIRTLSIVILGGCGAFAQNSDLALMLGGFPKTGGTTANGYEVGFVTVGGEINYATQLHAFQSIGSDLYLELPVVLTGSLYGYLEPGNFVSSTHANVFFTPGVRLKFSYKLVSFYPAIGAGLASFGAYDRVVEGGYVNVTDKRITSWAVGFAGAWEFRASRRLGLRLEFRNEFTRAGLGGVSGHDHPLTTLGLAFHF